MAPKDESNSNFNKDELEAPVWLNKDFFTKILQKSENDKTIKVVNLVTSPASMKGDHYASIMFRFAVEYEQNGVAKNKSLILKTMPEVDGHKKDMLKESHIFETEGGMYTEVIPRFEKILKDAGDDVTLAPQCIYFSLSPKKCMIFEDIVPKGYIVPRNRFLNFKEVKATYSKIAKWHAVSYKIVSEEPTYFDKYRHGIFTLSNFYEQPLMANAIDRFISVLEAHSDLTEYIPHIEALRKDLPEKTVQSFNEYCNDRKENGLYVLCHGDFHCRNLMMKYNEKNQDLEDVLLLDFQFSYMGPLVNDLIYSMYMMPEADDRANRLKELFYFYFTTFQQTLKKIGFKGEIPKILDFYKQLIDHKHFEIYLLISFLPVAYNMFVDAADVEQLVTNEEYAKKVWLDERYIKEVRHILPQYLHKGYLEP